MFSSVEIFRTSSLGGGISSNPERTALRRRRPRLYWSFATKHMSQWLLLMKVNQISQIKECSAFLCMERCKSLGSLKSFLWYASQLLGPISILCLHIWVSSGLTSSVEDVTDILCWCSRKYSVPCLKLSGKKTSYLRPTNYYMKVEWEDLTAVNTHTL